MSFSSASVSRAVLGTASYWEALCGLCEVCVLLLLGLFWLRLAGLSGSRVETPVSFPGAPGSRAEGSSAERG